jgi:hypothetical protein
MPKMRKKPRVPSRSDLNRLVEKIAEEQARLQPLLPSVDPHDLNLILGRMFRPIEQRSYFIHRRGDMYVR